MEAKFTNHLSDAELERLAILAEECGEVIQVINKIIRHGYESYNPNDPKRTPNRRLLEKELGDLYHSAGRMMVENDVSELMITKREQDKALSIQPYLHHQ